MRKTKEISGPSDAARADAGGSNPNRRRGRPLLVPRAQDAVTVIAAAKVTRDGCPHCSEQNIAPWGWSNGMRRYRCGDCRRTFNAATKTALARLRKKEGWLRQGEALSEGVSLAEAARKCGVHPSTAFRWRHRFLAAPTRDKPEQLSGIVEAERVLFRESFKGRRAEPAPQPDGAATIKKRGAARGRVPVLIVCDRNGAILDAVLADDTPSCVSEALEGALTRANSLVCNGGALRAFGRREKIPVFVVGASRKLDAAAPEMHLANVSAYETRLRIWMRRFHGVATKNLPYYLGWRRALETSKGDLSAEGLLRRCFGIGLYREGLSAKADQETRGG